MEQDHAADAVSYAADGLDMRSDLFVRGDVEHLRPGVLVFPDAFGLGEHARSRAERLAALGYAALACDIHGGATLHDNIEMVMGLIAPLRQDVQRMRARAQGALTALREHPRVDPQRIAAIGFCFGGTMALELARSGAEIAGAVGFHSGLATPAPADAKNISGKLLVCIGSDDPSIDPAQRAAFEAEMREGNVNWQMNLYGGAVHAFTNPAADAIGRPEFARYHPQADARSWSALRSFLAEIFDRPASLAGDTTR